MTRGKVSLYYPVKEVFLLLMLFFVFYGVLYLLETPIHTTIEYFTTLRSEYTVGEQLSKFYLFLVLMVSYFSYRLLTESKAVKLSIGFLLFSLVMYLSESNMIRETAQPVFGVMGIAFTAYYLWRLRRWLSLFLFFTAFVFLSFGSLIDFIHERVWINAYVPDFIYALLDMASEERFDVIGALFFSLSAILVFWGVLRDVVKDHRKETLLLLTFSLTMTVGNGLIHYQYQPGKTLYLFATVLNIIGFSGITMICRYMFKLMPSRSYIPDTLFYTALFFAFVVLPGYHYLAWFASEHSLVLWVPVIVVIGIFMYLAHTFKKEEN